jgi:hypothetical protein
MPPSTVTTMDILGFFLIGPGTVANIFLRPGGLTIVPADGYDEYVLQPTAPLEGEDKWENVIIWFLVVAS